VLPDVDVDAAIAPFSGGCSWVNGQGCITIKRLLVHESRYDEWPRRSSKFAASKSWAMDSIPPPRSGPSKTGPQLLRLQATWRPFKKMASPFFTAR